MRNLLWSGVVCLVGLVGCRGWESEKPPVHLIPNMDTQEKGKSYRKDTTGLFEDGRMMRPPVAGTVARGQLNEDDAFFQGFDEDDEPVQDFPASILGDDGAPKPEVIARGGLRFRIYCSPCHGPNGEGDGTVTTAKGLLVAPPSMLSERVTTLVNGKLYGAIAYGVNVPNMSSYAAQIPVEDRWAISAWVRDLQRKKDPQQPWNPGAIKAPVITTASAASGAILYKSKVCFSCHSIDGSRLVGPSFKGIYGRVEKVAAGVGGPVSEIKADDAYLIESIKQPMAKIVDGYPPAMPVIALSDLELESLILYMKSLN
ncbi:MAG: c-type cytochrome [Myxococcales bacterium]|nr:c-type cytochrome [Myxococcales bacterium]MDP3502632.1 c-type cytochrome [Myxococcales bacterium]